MSLTSKYNYHLRKAIPLPEHFLTVKETVKENVAQHSDDKQTPELQGNKDRVLVQFN